MKYTEKDEERFNKVLREIQASVPSSLRKAALIEAPFTPTMKMVFEKALESPTVSEEKKAQIRNLLDGGDFSRTSLKEDPKITKQIDQIVQRGINKAIKEGRLPPRGHIKYLPSIIKINEIHEKENN